MNNKPTPNPEATSAALKDMAAIIAEIKGTKKG